MRVSFYMGDNIDGKLQCIYYTNGMVVNHTELSNYFPFNLEYSFDLYIDNDIGNQIYQLFVYDKYNFHMGSTKDRLFDGNNGFADLINYMVQIEPEISKIR